MSEFASLCLLSYNRPQFVVQAIESAIAMAHHPLEVVVHDDGSSAETVDALMMLRERRLISTLILNQEGHNEGQGIALNRMFEMAKGDPIVKADHDLIFKPGWLKQAVAAIDNNWSRGAVAAIANKPPERRIGCLGLFKYHVEPVRHEEMHLMSHQEWDEVKDFVGSAMVIPRPAFEKFGPFGERSEAFAEDYEFKMKIAADPHWALGLLPHDVVQNQGFGVGPSTVVVQKPDGKLTSREIKEGTFVL